MLIAQEYSEADDLAHIRWLASAFADPRYITIDGRPLDARLPAERPARSKRTTDLWRREAERLGFPGLYLCWVEGWGRHEWRPRKVRIRRHGGVCGVLELRRLFTAEASMRDHRILDYVSTYEARLSRPPHSWKHFPAVTVGWDNTARHANNATLFESATPEHYRRWLAGAVESLADVREEENYLFIVAWNEWAEGNHLEPDLRFGRAFLEATRSVLAPPSHPDDAATSNEEIRNEPSGEGHIGSFPSPGVTAGIAHMGALVDRTCGFRPRTIANLSVDTDVETTTALCRRIECLTIEGQPDSVTRLKAAGIDAVQCDITDMSALNATLADLGEVDGILLFDVLDDLPQLQRLLAALSAWSVDHNGARLFISVPNVAHFDRGVRLLLGDWSVRTPRLLARCPATLRMPRWNARSNNAAGSASTRRVFSPCAPKNGMKRHQRHSRRDGRSIARLVGDLQSVL